MYVPLQQVGAVAVPQGMGSIDLSTLTWEDYLLLGVGLMTVYAIASPDSALFTWSPKKRKRKKGGSSGLMGGLSTVLLVGGLGYAAYLYYTGTTTA